MQIKIPLHGVQRRKIREKTNPAIQKLDKLRRDHKLGEVIQRLSGRSPGQLDLLSLPCPINGQITDPRQIHDDVQDYFKDRHAIPLGLDPAAHHLAQNPTWWKSLLEYTNTGSPQLLTKRSQIPPPLQDGLRRACAVKVTPRIQTLLDETINKAITLEEFNSSACWWSWRGI